MRDLVRVENRGNLVVANIADMHFGALDPKTQYELLKTQIIDELNKLPILDIIGLLGDFFDRRGMSDSDATLYGQMLMSDIRQVAINKNASVVILMGTKQHDADQMRLFYHYLSDPEFDIRIVETIKFEYVKGAKILCIPELYGLDEKIYQNFLSFSGGYDMCFMHGTVKGAIYGDNAGLSRLFTIEDFKNCLGPIFAGHVHTAGCFNSDIYYCGSPLRWKFGEEQEKGYMICLYNMDTRKYYTTLIPVYSFRYDTVNIDEIISQDPKDVIEYINTLKEEGIDYLRLSITKEVPTEDMNIIKEYYRNNGHIKFKLARNTDGIVSSDISQSNEFSNYAYLFDNSLSEYDKLGIYIKSKEGIMIPGETIKQIVENDDFDYSTVNLTKENNDEV